MIDSLSKGRDCPGCDRSNLPAERRYDAKHNRCLVRRQAKGRSNGFWRIQKESERFAAITGSQRLSADTRRTTRPEAVVSRL